MASLKLAVLTETLERVHVVYVDRSTCKGWNDKKDPDDTPIFTGFYWLRGKEEGGPFKTRSAAVRDAYYRFVLRREAPTLGATGRAMKPIAAPKPAAPAKRDKPVSIPGWA